MTLFPMLITKDTNAKWNVEINSGNQFNFSMIISIEVSRNNQNTDQLGKNELSMMFIELIQFMGEIVSSRNIL